VGKHRRLIVIVSYCRYMPQRIALGHIGRAPRIGREDGRERSRQPYSVVNFFIPLVKWRKWGPPAGFSTSCRFRSFRFLTTNPGEPHRPQPATNQNMHRVVIAITAPQFGTISFSPCTELNAGADKHFVMI
jgi:hypothetical protein